MVAAETSRKPRSMVRVPRRQTPRQRIPRVVAWAHLFGVSLSNGAHLLSCGVPDEVQDYQLRIQHNRTCITSYAPYQLDHASYQPQAQGRIQPESAQDTRLSGSLTLACSTSISIADQPSDIGEAPRWRHRRSTLSLLSRNLVMHLAPVLYLISAGPPFHLVMALAPVL